MNILTSVPVAIGLIVGILLCIVLFKYANRDHKAKTDYDERQKNLRNNAYRYAFYTIVIYEAIMIILDMGSVSLPMEHFLLHFGAIIAGGIVQVGYSIWNDVYWGLNNDRKKYYIIFLVIFILNAIPIIGSLLRGGMIVDGKLSTPFLNVLCEILILAVIIELFIKSLVDRREDQEA
ncbi:MAG: hypothetical protein K6F53_11610 [Lachnospiraceae bacterium]|nr:hypothetical protein [Lachnospiraceae bacterium]